MEDSLRRKIPEILSVIIIKNNAAWSWAKKTMPVVTPLPQYANSAGGNLVFDKVASQSALKNEDTLDFVV